MHGLPGIVHSDGAHVLGRGGCPEVDLLAVRAMADGAVARVVCLAAARGALELLGGGVDVGAHVDEGGLHEECQVPQIGVAHLAGPAELVGAGLEHVKDLLGGLRHSIFQSRMSHLSFVPLEPVRVDLLP